ncbi:MAG: DUF2189 domain-containing protein [Rhodopila sp.]|nr:DUF2189 domain-containing protein [Rhodopila sp.]
MPIIHGRASGPPLPYAYHVRRVSFGQPFRWLAAGGRDLMAAPVPSLCYGLLFVIAGYVLTFGLWRINTIYLVLPLASGFMMLGPALTLGFQAISRDLERHERPSLTRALLAWRANAGPIFNAGLAFMFLFLVWFRLAELIFALSFPDVMGLDARGVLNAILFTADGWTFLALFLALGAAMAVLAFAGGAFALPMLLDRKIGMSEAIATSFAAVMLNLRTMALWAALLVVLTLAGMAAFYVGLAITLPLAGHATWHAYRAVIRPKA